MVLLQNRHRDQWIRIDSLEIHPNIHEQLISDKEPRIYNGDNKSLLNRWCWRKLNNNMQKNETRPLNCQREEGTPAAEGNTTEHTMQYLQTTLYF